MKKEYQPKGIKISEYPSIGPDGKYYGSVQALIEAISQCTNQYGRKKELTLIDKKK